MVLLYPTLIRHAESTISKTRQAVRQILAERAPLTPFPVIQTCPSPSCSCAEMPTGLDIDKSRDLNGSMSAYAQHLIISSGQSDWTSRIEDERDTASWGRFASDIKSALGRNGEFHDPYNNILVSTSSFKHDSSAKSSSDETEILLFPSFQHIRHQPSTNSNNALIRNFLLPTSLHPSYSTLPTTTQAQKTRISTAGPWQTSNINSPTILICSHGSRDQRCGILGPLLHAEFTKYISSQSDLAGESTTFQSESSQTINLGMISHIGGHKFAGNVILYIPQEYKLVESAVSHPLAGMGIWYGRVQPSHIQGIIEETLRRGRLIRDLFRGCIDKNGNIVRL